MSVPFEELIESPEVTLDDGLLKAVRRFKIDWDDSIDFCRELCGSWQIVDGSFVSTPPAPFPGLPQMVCRKAEFTPFPPDRIKTPASADLTTNTNQPEYALVTATYKIPENNNHRQRNNALRDLPPDGTFLTQSVDVGTTRIAIGARKMKFVDAGGALRDASADTSIGVDLPVDQFTLSWERVPYLLVPWQKISDARGTVNSQTFNRYPPDSVLFAGCQLQYEFQFSGDVLCKLHYRFIAKTVRKNGNVPASGWTHVWLPEAGDFVEVVTSGPAQRKLYQSSDFRNLFTFSAS